MSRTRASRGRAAGDRGLGGEKRRAISRVVRPATSRNRQRDPRLDGERRVQHVRAARERSSGIELTSASSSAARLEPREQLCLAGERLLAPVDRSRRFCGGDDPCARRARMPSRGQRSSAFVNASCTRPRRAPGRREAGEDRDRAGHSPRTSHRERHGARPAVTAPRRSDLERAVLRGRDGSGDPIASSRAARFVRNRPPISSSSPRTGRP